ncbi:H2BH2B-like [Podarcis lilfordi]|uniref:H2BH2B-like n=1 Tax=Podarcis lilfordi TaxID=74358 RepID=A0AA35JXQ4_9SAUR|nr:H2BH2B-like [Podarcis lilfordi]
MAAACRTTRRRTRLPKRTKQTTQKAAHGKLLPKQRKPNLSQGKQGRRKVVDQVMAPVKQDVRHPCDEFISKVLSQLHRDRVPISTKAKGKMITFIRRFYNTVSNHAKSSKRAQRTSTIGSRELHKALKRVLRKKQVMELVKTVRKVARRR